MICPLEFSFSNKGAGDANIGKKNISVGNVDVRIVAETGGRITLMTLRVNGLKRNPYPPLPNYAHFQIYITYISSKFIDL